MKYESNILLIPFRKYFYFFLKSIKQSYENENDIEFNVMDIGSNECKNSIVIINKLLKYLINSNKNNISNENNNNNNNFNNKVKILFNNENFIGLLNSINSINENDENNYIKIKNNIDYSLLNKYYMKQITSNESVNFIISNFLFQNSIYDERYFINEQSIIMGSKTREYSTYCIKLLSDLLYLREKELKRNGTMIFTIIGEYNILYHKIFIIIKSLIKQLLLNDLKSKNTMIDESTLNNIINQIVLPINLYTQYEIKESMKLLELKKTKLKQIECIGDHLTISDLSLFFSFINNLIEFNLKKLLLKLYFNNNSESMDKFYNILFTQLKEYLIKDNNINVFKDFKLNYYILSFIKS